jgi:hypothetical protein
MAIIPQLGGSFKLANDLPTVYRLVVALDGLEKQGKTNFALTAPGPIAYQSFDIGLEGVIEKFQTTKQIFLAEYGFNIDKTDDQAQIMAKAGPEWERFRKDFKEVMIPGFKTKKIRSGVWDTGSELWSTQRLARLGKLTQVMPHHYTALNAEYQNLVREVYETGGNLVILHKLKAEWKENATTGKGNKTGAFERDGFSGTGFLVQVNATAWRDNTGVFHITVKDCRQNPGVVGLDLFTDPNHPDPQNPFAADFAHLATFVYPDTTVEYWS